MKALAGACVAALLTGGAGAAELPARFEAKTVCQYVVGVKALGPVSRSDPSLPSAAGMMALDEMVRGGVMDLDGDGVMEKVVPDHDTGTMGGDAYSVVKADGGDSFIAGMDMENGGFGSAFLSFAGRWYFVTFAAETGAFVSGVFTFSTGSLELVPACAFANEVTETMFGGTDASQSDQEWCSGPAPTEAKAGRLTAIEEIDEATATRLADELIASLGDTALQGLSGREIYAPASGPFAGLKLWKVNNSSGAGRGCAGSFFRLVEGEGASLTLSASPLQSLLNRMQSGEDEVGVFNCLSDVALFEANGRFFLDRNSGDEPAVTDQQLNHAFIEGVDGAPREICRSSYDVTPRVTFESPELSK